MVANDNIRPKGFHHSNEDACEGRLELSQHLLAHMAVERALVRHLVGHTGNGEGQRGGVEIDGMEFHPGGEAHLVALIYTGHHGLTVAYFGKGAHHLGKINAAACGMGFLRAYAQNSHRLSPEPIRMGHERGHAVAAYPRLSILS